MAAKSRLSTALRLFIVLTVSAIPQSSSQSSSPQNFRTFYPLSLPPPTILPPPPPITDPPDVSEPTPPTPPPQPQSPPAGSSTRAAVGRAIGVTAASTLVLSALVFFLLQRHSRRKRKRDVETARNVGSSVTPHNGNFRRFRSNVKGVIVDENGLDVLYWRNFDEEENRKSFKRQNHRNSSLNDEQKEEKRTVGDGGRLSESPAQEVPLPRGKSSASQSPIWGESEEKEMKSEATISSPVVFKVEEKQASSVQLVKTPAESSLASAAVPKGKMAAPLPASSSPPPSHEGGALPKGEVASILPPPPIPLTKGSAPPPPPPPPGAGASVLPLKPMAPNGTPTKRSSSLGEGESGKGNGQMKLKPLHWDKVKPNAQFSMVWDKIDQGSFKFDGDLMEALFGYVAKNRKSPQRDSRSVAPSGDKSGPPSQIFILDTRKSQNTAIVIKSLGVTRKDIIDALNEGQGLDADTLEKLTTICPTDEEASEILAFDGEPARLAYGESFLYHLLKAVPSAFARFHALLFRSNYDVEVSHLKESLQSLEAACKELRSRGLFLKLLEAVLKAGNRLNAGTSRGNAQAFNLTALRKLSDVKSSDGKTTLLQFVVQEVIRAEGRRCVLNKNGRLSRTSSQGSNTESQSSDSALTTDDSEREYMMLGLPVIRGLSSEFSNVQKAAMLDYDVLIKTSSVVTGQVVEIQEVVGHCGDGGFARKMKGFLSTAESEIKMLMEEQTRVMEFVKKTTDYYQAGSSKDKDANPLRLFVIVRDFLGMVDQVCVEIARNVQKSKVASSVGGSPSRESARVFRFPKLPANFLSDSSRSSSSDSDNDSD